MRFTVLRGSDIASLRPDDANSVVCLLRGGDGGGRIPEEGCCCTAAPRRRSRRSEANRRGGRLCRRRVVVPADLAREAVGEVEAAGGGVEDALPFGGRGLVPGDGAGGLVEVVRGLLVVVVAGPAGGQGRVGGVVGLEVEGAVEAVVGDVVVAFLGGVGPGDVHGVGRGRSEALVGQCFLGELRLRAAAEDDDGREGGAGAVAALS
mmetsp:Transcript_11336/g.33924  ORF Transcript_11336/g.33924 Transcript_11336/m.33924 type:complete len:206 (-) Transcript_11336:578-1195(-)